MIGYPEAPKAWWMTRYMARVSHVNLSQAVVEGWLRRDELAELVSRCATCGSERTCETWLAASGNASRMPDFCPNRKEIEALHG
jgi:Family of unknown function (DUF6455)